MTTGKMAAKILTGEANISEMPIEYFPDPVKKYNPAICEALGITVPEDYVAIGCSSAISRNRAADRRET